MRGGSSLGLPVADCLPDWLAGIAPSHTPLADSRLIRGAGLLDMLKPQYCCHLRGIFLRPTSMILIFNTPGESPADGENVQVSPLIMNASLVSLPSSPGVGCRVGGAAAAVAAFPFPFASSPEAKPYLLLLLPPPLLFSRRRCGRRPRYLLQRLRRRRRRWRRGLGRFGPLTAAISALVSDANWRSKFIASRETPRERERERGRTKSVLSRNFRVQQR